MAVILRALIIFACAASIGLMAWTKASAWVFYVDQRLVSNSRQVGQISFDMAEGHSTGTAFLIEECEVLTNFHVAFGPWYVTALRPPSRANAGTFELSDVTLADGSHPTARAIPIAWGQYMGIDRQFRKPGEDWVLLTLDKCLGHQYGYYTLVDPTLDEDAAESGSLAAIGYSSGRQMVDSRCSIHFDKTMPADGALFHDCATLLGDSGGPIVKRGTSRVVAITSGYRASKGLCAAGSGHLRGRWSSDCTNTAVAMSQALTQRIDKAVATARAQRELLRLGYDAGALGDIASPKLAMAIRAFEQKAGMAPIGEGSWSLVSVMR